MSSELTPREYFERKTHQVTNALSENNYQILSIEFGKLILDEYLPFLASHIVQRALNEVNRHLLYSKFLESINNESLNNLVLSKTVNHIKKLINLVKNKSHPRKFMLNNLGSWLGIITIGRNQPIPQSELDLIALLTEAYNSSNNELMFIVPLASSILESCVTSEAYGSENPWTKAVVQCLAKIHGKAGLQLYLQCQIERVRSDLKL